jgi:hypothetical protein
MQFKVPQFIDIEDKIFGPFTFRQFAYMAGGAGALYLCFKILPFPFSALLGLAFAGFGIALAFYKYNEKPFINFVESFVKYHTHARLYIWQKKKAAKMESPDELGTDSVQYNTPIQGNTGAIDQSMYVHQKANVQRFTKEGAGQQQTANDQNQHSSGRVLAPKADRVLRPSLSEDKLKTLSRSLDGINNK